MGNYLLRAKTDPSVTMFPQDDILIFVIPVEDLENVNYG
jgi:hypothetical protein